VEIEKLKESYVYKEVSAIFNRYNVDTTKIKEVKLKDFGKVHNANVFIDFEEPIEVSISRHNKLLANYFWYIGKHDAWGGYPVAFKLTPQNIRTLAGDFIKANGGEIGINKSGGIIERIILSGIETTEIHLPLTMDKVFIDKEGYMSLYGNFCLKEVGLQKYATQAVHLTNGDEVLLVANPYSHITFHENGVPEVIYGLADNTKIHLANGRQLIPKHRGSLMPAVSFNKLGTKIYNGDVPERYLLLNYSDDELQQFAKPVKNIYLSRVINRLSNQDELRAEIAVLKERTKKLEAELEAQSNP
jgi:hypothetical protein